MDGFKNSTKTQYMKGGSCAGYAKGGAVGPKGAAKISKVMGEFKRGTLHSGKSGPEVTNPKQAVAIALSEARRAPMKKARGGMIESTSARPEKIGLSDEERVAQRAMRSAAMEEAGDGLIVRQLKAPRPKPRAMPQPVRDPREPVIPQTPLSRRLTQLPSQRGELTVKR